MNTSLFLAQSYQDAWADYQRSLTSPSFPVWDHIIITASNEHQAEGYRLQLEERKTFLPERTAFTVIPDEGGVRVGSGGATLSVLKYLREQNSSFRGLRVLVIHSGGDSQRVPQYSALGKLFSPVPHRLPDGRSSTLFDEFMISMASVPGRIREGMLLLSGDVLLLFNPLLIDYSGRGAAVISFKENVETGKDHGVYLQGENGFVKTFLHKQSEETLRKIGAVNERNAVDIDTGAIVFGPDVLEALYGLISTDGSFDPVKYAALVNEKTRLSLYGDFQYPLAMDSTLEQFFREQPEGSFTEELHMARGQVWEALRPFRLKLLRLAPARFIHFGTTREVLEMMNGGVDQYQELGWSRLTNSSLDRASGYDSVCSPDARIGRNVFLEVSYVHSGASVGEGCLLSCIDIHSGEQIPPRTVLHGLKQRNGRFVCRIYGVDDDPKKGRLFGRPLEGNLWEEKEAHTLWNAALYPECDTVREAVAMALKLYELVLSDSWKKIEAWPGRRSLRSGFYDADTEAILSWNHRMRELVQMNDIAGRIGSRKPAEQGCLRMPLTRIQDLWFSEQIGKADYSLQMRLHYYVGRAMGGAGGEQRMSEAFRVLSREILTRASGGLNENDRLRIVEDHHEVSLPLRVNWGGGWSDTPPYCNEKGGSVLNAAILLNGDRPVRVTFDRLPEKKIVFESRDMDVRKEFSRIEDLQSVGDPFDPFVLQKAALLSCGVISPQGGSLAAVLDRLGGGFLMDTEVVGVPKGSGLGTSSILAAACVKGLLGFLGFPCTEEDLYRHVLCMEQIMSTGGGWQDQAGGVTDGIKFITSGPGLDQELKVVHVQLSPETKKELNDRFALIYTGQRRLARNLLRDVVGRYIGNEPETVYALNEIQRVAALMRFELERGRVDAFAELMDRHWELSRMIDSGSTNTLIDQIFASVEDLLAGRMICGAGGGGFLQVILKNGVSRENLQKRLESVFEDTGIGVWDCTLI